MTVARDAVVVVTGAGSGIGRAIAVALAPLGPEIWLVGRRIAALESAAAEASRGGARARCWQADITRDDDVDLLARTLAGETGRLDVLVHSAGDIRIGPVQTAPVEDLDALYRVNLRAPFVLTQRLLPALLAAQGQVVFVNSQAGLSASPQVSQYASTKFGLRALADSLRAEVNPAGVRVLSIYPGRTATPMQEMLHDLEGRDDYDPARFAQPEDVAALVVQALTLPRTSEVTDLSARPMHKR